MKFFNKLSVFFILIPSFVQAAEGDLLFNCSFDGPGTTASEVILACGGLTAKSTDNVASIVADGHDGKKAISYYYPNTGIEIVNTFSTPVLNKPSLTITYWEKFDVPGNTSNLWNVKSIRPYIGPGGNDYMAAIMSRHNNGSWYQSRWGSAQLTTTSAVKSVLTSPNYCMPSGAQYLCSSPAPDDGRLEISLTEDTGTDWHHIRVYMKVPSSNSASDGQTIVWIDGNMIYTLNNISKSPNWSADWKPYTTYIDFHPSDDFFQGGTADWAAQRFSFHHLYDDIKVYEGFVPPPKIVTGFSRKPI